MFSQNEWCSSQWKGSIGMEKRAPIWIRQQYLTTSHTTLQCNKDDTPAKSTIDHTKKNGTSSGPLDIKTKAGKMIISAVEDIQKETPITIIKKSSTATDHTIDLFNKSGTLNVLATTTKDNKLDVSRIERRNSEFQLNCQPFFDDFLIFVAFSRCSSLVNSFREKKVTGSNGRIDGTKRCCIDGTKQGHETRATGSRGFQPVIVGTQFHNARSCSVRFSTENVRFGSVAEDKATFAI